MKFWSATAPACVLRGLGCLVALATDPISLLRASRCCAGLLATAVLANSGFLLDDLRTQGALLELTSAQALRFQNRRVLGCHQHPNQSNRAKDEPDGSPFAKR